MTEPSFESLEYMSQEEFALFLERLHPADPHRYELLNGRIVMTPPAGFPHGANESRIDRIIGGFVDSHRLGRVFGSSQGYELPTGDTVAADLTFISHERWEAGPAPEEGKFLRIVPDLVVEILSSKTASRDRGEKKAINERNGVREYWIVDPRARRITRFVRTAQFDVGTAFEDDTTFESVVLDGLRFPVADAFAI